MSSSSSPPPPPPSSQQPSCSTTKLNPNVKVTNSTSAVLDEVIVIHPKSGTYQQKTGGCGDCDARVQIAKYDGPLTESAALSSTSSSDGTIIREFPDESQGECSSISGVLRYCKKRILYPYLKLLGIMGLKPLNADSSDSCTLSLILNKLYIVIVTLLLLAGYVLQYLICFRRDRGFSYKEELSEMMPYNVDNDHLSDYYNHDHHHHAAGNCTSTTTHGTSSSMTTTTTTIKPILDSHHIRNICSGNLFYVHLIPSCLHFVSFCYMLYLYWLNHDEQLQNLMERVFIQATQAHCTVFSPKKVLRTLKVLVMFGCSWLILSVVCIVVQVYYHRIVINFWESTGIVERKTMGGVMGFSTLWQDAIQVTVIISYCIHCHLLSTYLDFLHSRISQHSITLDDCIKELGEIDKLLQYINCKLANGLLPLLLLDAIFCITSLTYFLGQGWKLPIHDFIIQAIICNLWISLLAMPMIQAARLSTGLKKVRELGHLVRMRPFGYQQYQQTDLDSFLLFVSTVKMDVRICRIPLSATSLSRFTCCLIFVLFLWGYFQ